MSFVNTAVTAAVANAERRQKNALAGVYSGRSRVVLQRGFFALRTSNLVAVATGFLEPLFFLLAFGFGLGALVGGITDGSGQEVTFAAYIAPALLATSAMNGAIFDSTWNVYFKMHFAKLYESMLATSLGPLDVALGEIAWALVRGAMYAISFMMIMWPLGLIPSAWGLLAIPGAVLIAFGFSSVGMAITSYLKSFHQMNYVNFFMLPMFLFSGTFYPLSVYPDWLQALIQALPLWHAIQLERAFTLGHIDAELLGHLLYFAVMIVLGLVFTTRRLTALFMR